MDLTGLLVALLVGGVCGFLAGQIVKGHGFGVLGNIVVGVLGALLFGALFGSLNLLSSPTVNEIVGKSMKPIFLF
jgi:uncharacterized membrane protein YeaQ/YmgE (transglycosylase-associated protein family)